MRFSTKLLATFWLISSVFMRCCIAQDALAPTEVQTKMKEAWAKYLNAVPRFGCRVSVAVSSPGMPNAAEEEYIFERRDSSLVMQTDFIVAGRNDDYFFLLRRDIKDLPWIRANIGRTADIDSFFEYLYLRPSSNPATVGMTIHGRNVLESADEKRVELSAARRLPDSQDVEIDVIRGEIQIGKWNIESGTLIVTPSNNWLIKRASFRSYDPSGALRSHEVVNEYGPVEELRGETAIVKRISSESWTNPPDSKEISNTVTITYNYSATIPEANDFKVTRFGLREPILNP